jgi:hypothetical protein
MLDFAFLVILRRFFAGVGVGVRSPSGGTAVLGPAFVFRGSPGGVGGDSCLRLVLVGLREGRRVRRVRSASRAGVVCVRNEYDVVVCYRCSDGRFMDTSLQRLPIEDVLAGLPGREFRSYRGQRHYSGWYLSATAGEHVAYESRLELARILLADRDPETVKNRCEPKSENPTRNRDDAPAHNTQGRKLSWEPTPGRRVSIMVTVWAWCDGAHGGVLSRCRAGAPGGHLCCRGCFWRPPGTRDVVCALAGGRAGGGLGGEPLGLVLGLDGVPVGDEFLQGVGDGA